MYQTRFLFAVLACATLLSAASAAEPAKADAAAGARHQVLLDLAARLKEQLDRLPQCEVMRQTHTHPNAKPPQSHVLALHLDRGVAVVTESANEDGIFTQKDYFLHESKVYAHRVSRHEPCMDGKTKRVAESYFLIHDGRPLQRTMSVARVPSGDKAPDLSKAKEIEVPVPPGMEGWGDRLTERAFNIARTFRSGVGQHAFGDWDSWLLKDAPPEGAGEPVERDEKWLPPVGTLVLPISDTMSPDGMFEIGWGYEKGPVDWKRLAYMEGQSYGTPSPTFSTKLAEGQLPPELEDDGIFVLNHLSQKSLARLGVDYPGERQRFNHDELIAHWSPTSACFVVRAEQKWFTEYAEVGWIKDGKCAGSSDVLKLLDRAAEAAVLASKHPAANRLRKQGDDAEGYSFSISKLLLEDNGAFEADVVGQIPKDDLPSGLYEVIIEGVFTPGKTGEAAVLKTTKTRVLPPLENN